MNCVEICWKKGLIGIDAPRRVAEKLQKDININLFNKIFPDEEGCILKVKENGEVTEVRIKSLSGRVYPIIAMNIPKEMLYLPKESSGILHKFGFEGNKSYNIGIETLR